MSKDSHIRMVEVPLVLLDKIEWVNRLKTTFVIQEIGQENLRMLQGKVQGEKDYEPSSQRPPKTPTGGNAQVHREHKLLTPAFRTNPALLMHMYVYIL